MVVQTARFRTRFSVVATAMSATFIEPMECLAVSKLSRGSEWLWEIKRDGYRAEAMKSGGQNRSGAE